MLHICWNVFGSVGSVSFPDRQVTLPSLFLPSSEKNQRKILGQGQPGVTGRIMPLLPKNVHVLMDHALEFVNMLPYKAKGTLQMELRLLIS